MPDTTSRTEGRHRLLHLFEVDSTNAEALRRAEQGERGPLWVCADTQSRGRGRSGKSWHSPAGNLHASLLVELACPAETAQQLALVAGVAAADAVCTLLGTALSPSPHLGEGRGGGPRPRLKWPNDILLEGAKLGGILVEATTLGRRQVAVIGLGINLASAPEGLGRAVTHLGAYAPVVPPTTAFAALKGDMQRWLSVWCEGAGFDRVRAAWLARAGPVGEAIAVTLGTAAVSGTFLGLDRSGALMMRDAGGCERRFTFGEVSLLGQSGE